MSVCVYFDVYSAIHILFVCLCGAYRHIILSQFH